MALSIGSNMNLKRAECPVTARHSMAATGLMVSILEEAACAAVACAAVEHLEAGASSEAEHPATVEEAYSWGEAEAQPYSITVSFAGLIRRNGGQ